MEDKKYHVVAYGSLISHKSFREDFPNADYIMRNSFIVGCNHGLAKEHIDYMKNTFSAFLNKF